MCVSRDSPLSSRKMKLWRFTLETRNADPWFDRVDSLQVQLEQCGNEIRPLAGCEVPSVDIVVQYVWYGKLPSKKSTFAEKLLHDCRILKNDFQHLAIWQTQSCHPKRNALTSKISVFLRHMLVNSVKYDASSICRLFDSPKRWNLSRSSMQNDLCWRAWRSGFESSVVKKNKSSRHFICITDMWKYQLFPEMLWLFFWCLISIPTPLFSWQEHKRLLKLQEVGGVTKCDECILSNDNDGASENPTPTPPKKKGVYRVSPESVRDVHIVSFCT